MCQTHTRQQKNYLISSAILIYNNKSEKQGKYGKLMPQETIIPPIFVNMYCQLLTALQWLKKSHICGCLCLAKSEELISVVLIVPGSIYCSLCGVCGRQYISMKRTCSIFFNVYFPKTKVPSPLPFLKFCRAHILLEAFSLF